MYDNEAIVVPLFPQMFHCLNNISQWAQWGASQWVAILMKVAAIRVVIPM